MQAGADRRALIVAGPTCSGKSALALTIAERLGGAVINADSMQVYRELRIVTARPSAEEEARAPHLLYGVRPASQPCNVAWWRTEALSVMETAHARGLLPILCGGTGMYLAALTHGLAAIPDPGPGARAEARALLAELGPAALHARLAAVDPETASGLRSGDSQRIARAYEVWRGTGVGLAAWQAKAPDTPANWSFRTVLLDPPRPSLREAIAARFAAMLRAGALEEVRALMALDLDPALPAMRAHGVPELSSHLRGEIGLEEATERAISSSGRYTKKQATWFRHQPLTLEADQFKINSRISNSTQLSETLTGGLLNFIETGG
ncbi:MAG: tRNA (adenosine(37)-N6)-dimethylallyltransferase MiaA [Acetobacteraceae bacterium]|nr:tRNA (adenosine(37)-N6)-dimethylallyltransferase MiaA [Acetobacteraceae bacterium]